MPRPLALDPARRTAACAASPACRPASDLLARLDLPAHTPWRWLHLGPIGPETTPTAIHDPRHCCKSGGGGAQPCDECRPIWTRPEHARHLGHRLDLFCLTSRPAPPRRALPFRPIAPEPRLWPVAAFITHEARPDLYAACLAGPDGRPAFEYRGVGRLLPTGEDLDRLNRCADLILGAALRVGRKQRPLNPRWREIVEQAEALHARYPHLEREHVAARVMVPERTLRRWRAIYRRDRLARAESLLDGPTLIPGGLE